MPESTARSQQNIHLPYHQRLQAHHRKLAALAHRYTPRGRVLDVGCGLGHTLAELHRLDSGLELHAADMDAVCLDSTREKVPGVIAIAMRPDRLDVDSLGSGYQTVLMSHVLEHLQRPSEAVEQLLSTVRPGGHLILGVPNPVSPVNFILTMLRIRRVNPGHLQTWDRPHWMNLLETRMGLQVVEYAEDETRLFPVRWKQRARLLEWIQVGLAKLLPWWAHTQFAVIRRPPEVGAG